jgi:hypothetical protein
MQFPRCVGLMRRIVLPDGSVPNDKEANENAQICVSVV